MTQSRNIQTLRPIAAAQLDLVAEFQRCAQVDQVDQWEALALMYYARGYYLNALHCFNRADQARARLAPVSTATEG